MQKWGTHLPIPGFNVEGKGREKKALALSNNESVLIRCCGINNKERTKKPCHSPQPQRRKAQPYKIPIR